MNTINVTSHNDIEDLIEDLKDSELASVSGGTGSVLQRTLGGPDTRTASAGIVFSYYSYEFL